MSRNDNFLYALKDDLPQDFADDLRQQLHQIEAEKNVKPARNGLVMAAASFATLFFGAIMIFVSAPQLDFLVTVLNLPEEPLELVPITADNIAQAEIIASEGKSKAYRMALSPDNQTLAIATRSGIYLHDANDLNAEAQFIGKPERGVYHIEYTDNGDLYVLGWADEEMGIYRWQGEPDQFQLIDYLNFGWKIQTIDISPDGNRLLYTACVGDGGWYPSLPSLLTCTNPSTIEINILDLTNPDNNISIAPDNSANIAVSMSPDWSQLAYYDTGNIYLYDMVTGETRSVIETQIGTIGSDYPDFRNSAILHFTPDGRELGFLRMSTGKFHSWSVDELNQVDIVNPFILPTDGTTAGDLYAALLIFHPISHERLIIRSDSIIVYSEEDEATITEYRQVGQVRDMLMNSDGSRLYVMSSTGLVQALDWETQERINMNLDYSIGYNTAIEFSRDSNFFINNSSTTYDASISFLWNVENNELERHVFANDEQIANSIAHSAISPDSRYIAYEISGYIYIYDRIENEHRQLYPLSNVHSMGFRDDGQLIVISSENVYGGRGHIHNFTVEMIESGDVSYPLDYAVISDIRFGHNADFPSTTSTLLPGAEVLAVFQCDVYIESMSRNTNCTQHLVKLIDTETGEVLIEFETSMGITFISLKLTHSNDGQYLVMSTCERDGSSYLECRENSSVIDIWRIEDLLEGNTEALRVSGIVSMNDKLGLVAYENGSFLLTTSTWHATDEDENLIYEPYIYFWSISAEGEAEEVHRMQAEAVEISPDNKHMVVLVDGQYQLQAVLSDD